MELEAGEATYDDPAEQALALRPVPRNQERLVPSSVEVSPDVRYSVSNVFMLSSSESRLLNSGRL